MQQQEISLDGKKYLSERLSAKKRPVPNHPEEPKIEPKGSFPIPPELRGGAHNNSHFYPFEKMKVGESFWVPSTTYCTSGAASKFSKKTGWKFLVRKQLQDGTPITKNSSKEQKAKGGSRVWRIK